MAAKTGVEGLRSEYLVNVPRYAIAALMTVLLWACASGEGSIASHPATADGPVVLAAPLPASRAPIPTRVPDLPLREIQEQDWTPFAVVAGMTLVHPSRRVEVIGFHESTHDGARQMVATRTATQAFMMETRSRGTGSQTAADVVVDPDEEIRSPVTGTVLRAGTYVLYCEYSDDFAVIEPDAHPGWEVKILHIDGVLVTAGDRVEAGRTVLAGGPTPLPFRSQVDEATATASWPHVHIEVIDPSIPDRPSGSGC